MARGAFKLIARRKGVDPETMPVQTPRANLKVTLWQPFSRKLLASFEEECRLEPNEDDAPAENWSSFLVDNVLREMSSRFPPPVEPSVLPDEMSQLVEGAKFSAPYSDPLLTLCRPDLHLWFSNQAALGPELMQGIEKVALELQVKTCVAVSIEIHYEGVKPPWWGWTLGSQVLVEGQLRDDQPPCPTLLCNALLDALSQPGLPWLTNEVLGRQLQSMTGDPCMDSLPRLTWTTRDWRHLLQRLSLRGVSFEGWRRFLELLPEVWLELGGPVKRNRGPLGPASLRKAAKLLEKRMARAREVLLSCVEAPHEWEVQALGALRKGRLSKPCRLELRRFVAEKAACSLQILVDATLLEAVKKALRGKFPEVRVSARTTNFREEGSNLGQ